MILTNPSHKNIKSSNEGRWGSPNKIVGNSIHVCASMLAY